MARRERAIAGSVAWVDLQTPDLRASRAFYGELLGWNIQGDEYAFALVDGLPVAGLAQNALTSPFQKVWSVYLATDDVDETTRRVETAGGRVMLEPIEVEELGRMAFFADPTGAHFGVWEAGTHPGARIVGEPGAMAWHECTSRDAARARAFYGGVFGLESRRLETAELEYYTLHKGDVTVGGIRQMEPRIPREPLSSWSVYFAVAGADAAAARVEALGGTITRAPFDTVYGRITSAVDPAGAAFSLIQLA